MRARDLLVPEIALLACSPGVLRPAQHRFERIFLGYRGGVARGARTIVRVWGREVRGQAPAPTGRNQMEQPLPDPSRSSGVARWAKRQKARDAKRDMGALGKAGWTM